jgi:hypothetical protein
VAEERFATKEDIKRIEDKTATKEQFEATAISVEYSGREMVQYLLERRGYRCAAERLRLDADYEFDIYCNAGAITAVGEAKVRAGRRDVERTVERIRELQRRWPEKISGRLCPSSIPSSQSPRPSRGPRSSRCGSSKARGRSCPSRRRWGSGNRLLGAGASGQLL